MPIVRIEIYKGRTADYKHAILDGVHRALVDAFKIPDDDRNQILYEHSSENFERRSIRSESFTIVEITAFKGRSFDAKKLLYSEIVKNLKLNPGIEGNDIIIILNEQPLGNWGIHGGKPANETDIGFNINV